MQLDLAMEKELLHDSWIEIVSSEPCPTGYAVISARFPVSDVKQTSNKDWRSYRCAFKRRIESV